MDNLGLGRKLKKEKKTLVRKNLKLSARATLLEKDIKALIKVNEKLREKVDINLVINKEIKKRLGKLPGKPDIIELIACINDIGAILNLAIGITD